jgi:hypothetical protein
MKAIVVAVVVMLISSLSFAQDNEKDTIVYLSFEQLLDSAGMVFTAPAGYIETEPVHNMQMNYEQAYKHPGEKLEIRYAIRLHEFKFFEQIFMVTVLNISGGQLPEHTSFNPESAREEFGADGGATVFVPLGEEFGMGYKYCLFVYIYKVGVGDAYLFYLGDDRELISERMMDGFYSLKYKN